MAVDSVAMMAVSTDAMTAAEMAEMKAYLKAAKSGAKMADKTDGWRVAMKEVWRAVR